MDWRLKLAIAFFAVLIVSLLVYFKVFEGFYAAVDPVLSWWKYALIPGAAVAAYLYARNEFLFKANRTLYPSELIEFCFTGKKADPVHREKWSKTLLNFWLDDREFRIDNDKETAVTLFYFVAKPLQQFRGESRLVAVYNKANWYGDRVIQIGNPIQVLNFLQALGIGEALLKSKGLGKQSSLAEVVMPLLEDDDAQVRQSAVQAVANAQAVKAAQTNPQVKPA